MKNILKKGKITKLEGGDSEETFLIKHKGRKFVLRIYETEKEANYYDLIYKKLEKYNIFPKLYYKEKNKLLFEYIEGRDCKKSDALKVAFQVGRICALINGLNIKKRLFKLKPLRHAINIFRKNKSFKEYQLNQIERRYDRLKNNSHQPIALDFDDVYPQNFRLRKGKIYLVDIEDINYKFKGAGIAKSFIRWFRTPKQRLNFRRGYESIVSMKFLSKKYLQFLYFNFLIFNMVYNIKKDKELNKKDFKLLMVILSGDEIY